MDGPNVNWSLLRMLSSRRKVEGFPALLELGSCGLHIVHGASSLGHTKCGWKIDEILSSSHYVFQNSPLRRAQFIEITGSKQFPKKFCRIRWCENLDVAKRLIELIPLLIKYCSEVHPKKESY